MNINTSVHNQNFVTYAMKIKGQGAVLENILTLKTVLVKENLNVKWLV
jgi:hypothetical protein